MRLRTRVGPRCALLVCICAVGACAEPTAPGPGSADPGQARLALHPGRRGRPKRDDPCTGQDRGRPVPEGGQVKRVSLGEGYQHVVVGRLEADGSVSTACVDSAPQAEAFLSAVRSGGTCKVTLRKAVLAASLLAGTVARASATLVVNNADPAGSGFNDPTPVAAGRRKPRDDARGTAPRGLRGGSAALGPDARQRRHDHHPRQLPAPHLRRHLGGARTGVLSGRLRERQAPASTFPEQNTWYVAAETERFARPSPPLREPGRLPTTTTSSPTSTPASGRRAASGGVDWYYGFDGNHGPEDQPAQRRAPRVRTRARLLLLRRPDHAARTSTVRPTSGRGSSTTREPESTGSTSTTAAERPP